MKKTLQIATVSFLGVVLAAGLVVIYLLLGTDLLLKDHSNGISNQGYTGNNTANSVTIDDTVEKLSVEYTGGEILAGGQAIADDFVVEVVYKNGDRVRVTDYECKMLEDDFRLEKGSNTFVFTYGTLSAVKTVEANSINRYIFAPTYVKYNVDSDKAEALITQIESGEISYKDAFADVAFTGDSQIKALESFSILTSNTVQAEVGMSFDYLEENFDTVITKAYGKSALIVHYGINNLSTDEATRQVRLNQYKNLLARLKTELPGTRVIVSGLFPVSNDSFYIQPRFAYINLYNFNILEICMELGIEYYSNCEFLTDNQQYFEGDGLHLIPSFYTEYWLNDIIRTLGIGYE